MTMMICSVYEAQRRAQTYLFVERRVALSRVPVALRELIGDRPRHVMDIPLRSGMRLARIDAETLHKILAEQGYYLQLPPPDDAEVAALKRRQHEAQA